MSQMIRTCHMKHWCERESFARKRELHATSDYREYKWEVYDTKPELDPEWDGLDGEVFVFGSDNKSECEDILQRAHRYELRENGVCKVCDLYDKRQAALKEGRVQPFYLVVEGTSRHYGGPEEGGWWYDWHEVLEVRRAFTLEEGLRQMRQLRDAYPQPRYNRYSCANRGEQDTRIVLCYGEQDPRWPTESTQRPRYE